MNVERLGQLADHLRDPLTAPHFRLGEGYFAPPDLDDPSADPPPISKLTEPNASGGVDAHTMLLADPTALDAGAFAEEAANWLEIDLFTAKQLFFPPAVLHPSAVTAAQAADVVDHLAESGVVDWSILD